MATDDITRMLLDLDIFRDVDPATAERIAHAGERVVLRAGQPVIRSGEAGEAAFLLVAGDAVAAHDDGPATPVAPGSLVGELAMLVEHTFALTVTCESTVRAVRLDRRMMHGEMARQPALASSIVGRLSSRLTRIAIELRRVDELLALAVEPGPAPAARDAPPQFRRSTRANVDASLQGPDRL